MKLRFPPSPPFFSPQKYFYVLNHSANKLLLCEAYESCEEHKLVFEWETFDGSRQYPSTAVTDAERNVTSLMNSLMNSCIIKIR